MKPLQHIMTIIAVAVVAFIAATAGIRYAQAGSALTSQALREIEPVHAALSTQPESIIGAYVTGVPNSLDAVNNLESQATANLSVVMYYSGWGEQFKTSFAADLDEMHVTPLVQIQPTTVSLAEIMDGSQDGYLISYANAVRLYGHAVILSFGEKMNGNWYSWGYGHNSPAEFVGAWRHIVNLFQSAGADNVTWLWTVNSMTGTGNRVSEPGRWWPGSRYVTWVGIDGYYTDPDETFMTLFGPTIADIRKVTDLPILITDTGASPQAGKATKIADLLGGIKRNKMLGFVWHDAKGAADWRLDTPPAIAAFRAAANKVR